MELSKYIVVLFSGEEQAVVFPSKLQHAEVFNYMNENNREIRAISAGFFCAEQGEWWHGGESESIKLKSRPEDGPLIQKMLRSPERCNWDLRILVWQAYEAAKRSICEQEGPEIH